MTNKKDTQKIVKHPVRGRGRDCDKQKGYTEDREAPCEG